MPLQIGVANELLKYSLSPPDCLLSRLGQRLGLLAQFPGRAGLNFWATLQLTTSNVRDKRYRICERESRGNLISIAADQLTVPQAMPCFEGSIAESRNSYGTGHGKDSKASWAINMSFGKTIPILRIFDEVKAREFYIDFLGFQVDWEHRFAEGLPLYMQISKDSCIIHLSEHHGDCSPGTAIRIETNELEIFQEELLAKNYKYSQPEIEEMPWGSRDMSVSDPFSNRLTFTSVLST